MSVSEKERGDQTVKEKSNELRTKYPIFTAIVESIPVMDLKDAVSFMVLVDPMRSILKTHAMRLTFIGEDKGLDRMVEGQISELRPKHAALAGVLERIHNMDLKETATAILGIDALESLLKMRAFAILGTPGAAAEA